MSVVNRFAHIGPRGTLTQILKRWGAAAACLAGISYGAWGYLDRPDAPRFVIRTVLPVLELITPVLFLGGLVSLYCQREGGGSRLESTGLLLGLLGTVMGVINGADRRPTLPYLYLAEWWTLLFAGLVMMGVARLIEDTAPLPLGILILASGALGFISVLTDPAYHDVLVPMQPIHVAFAALFCVSVVAWGWLLFRESGP